MTDDKFTDLAIKITGELSSLNANMRNVLEKLTNHENRITNLEHGSNGIKGNIVKWLTLALIGCVSVIVTLTGATSVLKLFIE